MRAEYILKAVEAMNAAYAYLDSHCTDSATARERGGLKAKLAIATIGIEAASGLREIEVSIEKEVA